MNLARFEILEDMKDDPQALVHLAMVLERKTFPVRELIVDEAKPANDMFFLIQGKASVNKMSDSGQIVKLANLDSNHHPFFGEASLLGFSTGF